MPVKIHNKEYYTVAERIAKFRADYPDHCIETELVSNTNYVIVKATISTEGVVISTGYAEEERGSTNINMTSAVENAETSAVGRALAFFGLAGTEIASADEVANAIAQQTEKVLYERFQATMKALLDNYDSVVNIKEAIAEGDAVRVATAFSEMTDDEKKALWVAPSKGGPFTTEERKFFQSTEYVNARNNLKGE